MKLKLSKLFTVLCLLVIASFAFSACGSSNASIEERLLGTWIADLISGDADSDADDSTVIYNSDNSVEVRTPEGILSGTWEADDETISTTIPEFEVTFMSSFSLMSSDNILQTMTDVGEGSSITEVYYRLTNNFPADLVGTWTPVSQTVFGVETDLNEVPALVLNSDGTGSSRWSVTEDRLLLLHPDTLIGQAFEYTLTEEEDGSITLVTTEDDDGGATVTTYTM